MANIEGFTEEAMSALIDYEYRGNVRELQNIVERVVVLKKNGHIDIEDLPEKLYSGERTHHEEAEAGPLDMKKGYDILVSEFEKSLIIKALGETQGVKSKAAQVLNINRTTLIERMKRLGLE
jgi:DNA-binding NtrC family response regulator